MPFVGEGDTVPIYSGLLTKMDGGIILFEGTTEVFIFGTGHG